MKCLILGGSGFIGQHLVRACVAAEFEVTVACRGRTKTQPLPSVRYLTLDRDGDLRPLKECAQAWDVCIDLSGYTAKQVRRSSEVLQHQVGHYIYISAIRALVPEPDNKLSEQCAKQPLLDENITVLSSATYGPLKATCEAIVNQVFLQRATILRPQVVVGADDRSGRISYWLSRRQQSHVLLPGDGNDVLQFVDVHDVVAFILHAAQTKLLGEFNLAGDPLTWQKFAALCGLTHGSWVDNAILERAGLSFQQLPLYRPSGSEAARYMNVCNQKARQHGFVITPIEHTLQRLIAWIETSSDIVDGEILQEQLTFEQERTLIAQQILAQ